MATQRNDLLVDVRQPIRDEIVANLRDLGLSKAVALAVLDVYPDGRGLWGASKNALLDAGLTDTQAKRVLAAFRVANACDRSCQMRAQDEGMSKPSVAAEAFRRAIGRREQEFFAVALLDSRQKVIDILGVSVGSLSQVEVHPRELFRDAVRRGAHSVILAHNHPSGDPTPSQADFDLTQRMVEAGKLVGIPVLDHIVMTPDAHRSIAAAGHIENPAGLAVQSDQIKNRLMR